MKERNILPIIASALLLFSCDFLEPLPNGSYNEENVSDYPTLIRGYIDKAYNLRPSTYYSTEFLGTDAISDDMVYRDRNNGTRRYSVGSGVMTSNPFSSLWDRDYKAIYYVNLFLKDDIGRNTRYLVDNYSNMVLQNCLVGDAYGLRAWYMANLLQIFGGRGTDGKLLGVPIVTEPLDMENFDASKLKRASYDDCVKQILADCDSALCYLPLVNRDQYFHGEAFHVTGAVRYRSLDAVSIMALRAKVCLTWASPAFNPENDLSRWNLAATYAKEVIDHKINEEGSLTGGFNPKASFQWTNPNSAEIVYLSDIVKSATFETHFYPLGFGGNADLAPSQNLVDAFPMANGYPISDPLSGYDPANPYAGRDPRFYANIFYNGSQIYRNQGNGELMYVIQSAEGGKDAPGGMNTSPTGYYAKKYVYLGWNPNDATIETAQHCIFFYRWAHMCLTFAEAANRVGGPNAKIGGLSAREALAYIRNRQVDTGAGAPAKGVGEGGDPYLNACCASQEAFEQLVRNEWRVETCMEGIRYFNLRRWASSVDDINVAVNGVNITGAGYSTVPVEVKKFPSLWNPIPYLELRKAPGIVQNEGWESWK